MEKINESPIKPSSFLQKFNGKVNKVPRLGINAVLLREQFEKELGLQMDFKPTKSTILTKENPVHLFRSSSSAEIDPIQYKLRLYAKNPETEQIPKQSKLHQRKLSERLPPIGRYESASKQTNETSRIREKLKSEQVPKGSAVMQRYRGFKNPPRLSEKALRLFWFPEVQIKTRQRSVRN